MAAKDIRFGDVDLLSCDLEPIHIPGSIQPHGVLIVVDRRDLSIRQFAGDTLSLLGIEPELMPAATLPSLLEEKTLAAVVGRLGAGEISVPSIFLGLAFRGGAGLFDLTVHTLDDLGFLEIEPARRDGRIAGESSSLVKSMLAGLQAAEGFDAFCAAAAVEVREATGFDRVMIYRFLHDGSGEVIAEDRADGIDSFLGLHYPASDVPRQARELYLRNWLRLIPDVNYSPALLQTVGEGDIGRPTDMSHCALRSVSPIHLEYLRNLGVAASMSISIILGGKLWGLIVCHNATPHFVNADLRGCCELFGQIFSLQLTSKLEAAFAQRRIEAARVHEAMVALLARSQDVALELATVEAGLLELIPAGGLAVCLGGQLRTLGETPPPAFIGELVAWLNDQALPLVHSFQLGSRFAPALPFAATASGLLAISLSRRPADYVMWFRPEIARSVTWAGNPHKPVQHGPHGDRLTPRKSFELWRETVSQQSSPWDSVDIESAQAFRVWLLETVLRQLDEARQEREAAFAQQNLLMAELDHRVKNILANIQALVGQTELSATSVSDFALALQQRIRAMGAAHGMLAKTRWVGTSIGMLVAEELAPYLAEKPDKIAISGDDSMLTPAAALSLCLILHELTANAARYGSLSTPGGCLDVGWSLGDGDLVMTWRERLGPAVAAPAKRGFGSAIIERSLRYEIQGTSILTFAPDGVVCELAIPRKHLVPAQPGEAGHG